METNILRVWIPLGQLIRPVITDLSSGLNGTKWTVSVCMFMGLTECMNPVEQASEPHHVFAHNVRCLGVFIKVSADVLHSEDCGTIAGLCGADETCDRSQGLGEAWPLLLCPPFSFSPRTAVRQSASHFFCHWSEAQHINSHHSKPVNDATAASRSQSAATSPAPRSACAQSAATGPASAATCPEPAQCSLCSAQHGRLCQ